MAKVKPKLTPSEINAKILQNNKIKEVLNLKTKLLTGIAAATTVPKLNIPKLNIPNPFDKEKTKTFLSVVVLVFKQYLEQNPDIVKKEGYDPRTTFSSFWSTYKKNIIKNYKTLVDPTFTANIVSALPGRKVYDEYLEETSTGLKVKDFGGNIDLKFNLIDLLKS